MIEWNTTPNFDIIDVLQYMYPSIKCSVENNRILKYSVDETNTPTKNQIEDIANSTNYNNYRLCNLCKKSGGFISNCSYGSLNTQKGCLIEQIENLETEYNNGWVYFTINDTNYKTSLNVTSNNASKVIALLQRAYAEEWDDTNDKFKCYKVSDDSPQLISGTKQQAKKLAKGCSRFQSDNVKNKELLIAAIEAAESIESLHSIDITLGWANSTIDINS